MLRTELFKYITGIPSDYRRNERLVIGMYQMGVDAFGIDRNGKVKGFYTGDRFPTHLTRKHLLVEDREILIQDVESLLTRQAVSLLRRTEIQHRFCYRLLPNYNLLIGFDPREFEDDPIQDPVHRGDTEEFY